MKHALKIIGLGPGGFDNLSVGNLEIIKTSGKLMFRTGKHPVVERLRELGLQFNTFDSLYEEMNNFDEVYAAIAEAVIDAAREGPVVFAVPGHPLVGEKSVLQIIERAQKCGIFYEVFPAMSFLDPVLAITGGEVSNLKLIDGLELVGDIVHAEALPEPLIPNIVMQVYNPLVASEVKLSLMRFYPDEHPVKVISAAGVPSFQRVADIPLYEMDRLDWIDHLTCIYIPPFKESKTVVSRYPVDKLVDVLERLRDIDGCPWDREQTHESLKKYMIEETYEVLDAIDEGNMYKVCEELGDLLLQVAFHAQIAKEDGHFDMNDVTRVISEKLVRRHPHVFADATVKSSEEVSVKWEEIKKGELKEKGEFRESLLDGIPRDLPALMKADKIQRKAAKVGFEWSDYTGALEKVVEETNEIKEAIHLGRPEEIRAEIGDLLFAAVNLGRMLHVDSEEALILTVNKFRERFRYIEKLAAKAGLNLEQMDLEELDRLWGEAKKSLKT